MPLLQDSVRSAAKAVRRRWAVPALVLAATLALCIAMQSRAGVFHADIDGDNDEPAHAVTSLMVHDYLVQDLGHNPLAFARDFYAHYAKVAFGHWPPLFYCAEATWMLLLGRTRAALVLFVALCGALTLTSLFVLVWRRASLPAACVAVLAAAGIPSFQEVVAKVRPDLPLALLVFWAAIYLARWRAAPTPRNRNLAILFTLAALLVHQRAVVIFFVPFLLLPFYPPTPRTAWRWFAGAALLIAGEFAAHSVHLTLLLSPASLHASLHDLVTGFAPACSPAILLFTPLGLALAFRRGSAQPFWAAMAALLASGPVFHLVAPVVWEDHYQLPSFLGAAALAGGGAYLLLEHLIALRPHWKHWAFPVAAMAATAFTLLLLPHVRPKMNFRYSQLVARCMLCDPPITLIAADAANEGALIAEASLADPHRTRTVLRASKALSHSSWSGLHLTLRYDSPRHVLSGLDQQHITQIVLQPTARTRRRDVDQLGQALELPESGWTLDPDFAIHGNVVYRRIAPGKGQPLQAPQ